MVILRCLGGVQGWVQRVWVGCICVGVIVTKVGNYRALLCVVFLVLDEGVRGSGGHEQGLRIWFVTF